ncbi:MAG: hypothetical protein K8R02_08630 [Anaerohalosphaeraceae bacterium]|nr:hypothetical protein [Anaerohalosphaeraceae bacterium]
MAKNIELNSSKRFNNFWLIACLLAVLLGVIGSRDITRPFTGLHSWAQANGAWSGRTHAVYGLGYTKGIRTFALGQPPTETPKRYWDHPQLGALMAGVTIKIFGINESSMRIVDLMTGLASLFVFLLILRGLFSDDRPVILSALLLILMPLIGYFGMGSWANLLIFGSIYFYLVCIKGLNNNPEPKLRHRVGLGACLFLCLQFSWMGFFYAFAIGSHYVLSCIIKKRRPDWGLLSILFFAPVVSLMITFLIMAGGYDWDVSKIIELYKWRSAKGEMQNMQVFDWGKWFSKLWQYCVEDFTKPLLILSMIYFTIGQLFVFMETDKDSASDRRSKQFPVPWLFIFPAILFLMVFRGLVWKHQYWIRPLAVPIAIATALAILMVGDFIKRTNKKAGIVAIVLLVAMTASFCVVGTNHFHSVRWQAQAKVDMFKKLNSIIPLDKRLLSFEDFIVNQHKSKGGFIRPEIAWYLDREIDVARSVEQVQQMAKTGKYPYYLMPLSLYDQKTTQYLSQLSNQLRNIYRFEYVAGAAGERTKDGKFLKAGMNAYIIFDLNSKAK